MMSLVMGSILTTRCAVMYVCVQGNSSTILFFDPSSFSEVNRLL